MSAVDRAGQRNGAIGTAGIDGHITGQGDCAGKTDIGIRGGDVACQAVGAYSVLGKRVGDIDVTRRGRGKQTAVGDGDRVSRSQCGIQCQGRTGKVKGIDQSGSATQGGGATARGLGQAGRIDCGISGNIRG